MTKQYNIGNIQGGTISIGDGDAANDEMDILSVLRLALDEIHHPGAARHSGIDINDVLHAAIAHIIQVKTRRINDALELVELLEKEVTRHTDDG